MIVLIVLCLEDNISQPSSLSFKFYIFSVSSSFLITETELEQAVLLSYLEESTQVLVILNTRSANQFPFYDYCVFLSVFIVQSTESFSSLYLENFNNCSWGKDSLYQAKHKSGDSLCTQLYSHVHDRHKWKAG